MGWTIFKIQTSQEISETKWNETGVAEIRQKMEAISKSIGLVSKKAKAGL